MKKYFIIAAVSLWFAPVAVLAQTPPPTQQQPTNTNLPTYSGVDDSIGQYLCAPTGDGQDLERCINRVYRFGIVAGALILVFMVVMAGYFYITGGETGIGKAKGIIKNSVVGMALLLGSYALLYFINPSLVAFKPIQPPIFDAGPLPSCSDIGISKDNDCSILSDEVEQTDTAPSDGGGAYADCQGGIVQISGIPRVGSGTRICQELLSKMQPVLEQFKAQAPGYYFGISSTIRDGRAESRCHYSGNSKSGNCADTVLRTSSGSKVPGNNAAWGTLCRLLLNAGLSLANETGSAHQGCRNPASYKYTSGPHFHVYVPVR